MKEPSAAQRAILQARCPALLEYHDRLRAGLEELLSVSERIHGGDPSLDPEEWYAARDYARVVLEDTYGR